MRRTAFDVGLQMKWFYALFGRLHPYRSALIVLLVLILLVLFFSYVETRQIKEMIRHSPLNPF